MQTILVPRSPYCNRYDTIWTYAVGGLGLGVTRGNPGIRKVPGLAKCLGQLERVAWPVRLEYLVVFSGTY
jgi:hypothetical protein